MRWSLISLAYLLGSCLPMKTKGSESFLAYASFLQAAAENKKEDEEDDDDSSDDAAVAEALVYAAALCGALSAGAQIACLATCLG